MLWTSVVIDFGHLIKYFRKICVHGELILTVNNFVKGLDVTDRRKLQHFLFIPQSKHFEVSTRADFFSPCETQVQTTNSSTP